MLEQANLRLMSQHALGSCCRRDPCSASASSEPRPTYKHLNLGSYGACLKGAAPNQYDFGVGEGRALKETNTHTKQSQTTEYNCVVHLPWCHSFFSLLVGM